MKLGKKQRYSIVIICSILIIAIFAFTIFLYSSQPRVLDVKNISTDLIVGYGIGFNTDTDALHFGKISPGGTVSRGMNFTHSYEFPVYVIIDKEGNFSQWISSDNKFYVNKGQIKEVKFYVNVPSNATEGKYLGTIKIMFMKK